MEGRKKGGGGSSWMLMRMTSVASMSMLFTLTAGLAWAVGRGVLWERLSDVAEIHAYVVGAEPSHGGRRV